MQLPVARLLSFSVSQMLSYSVVQLLSNHMLPRSRCQVAELPSCQLEPRLISAAARWRMAGSKRAPSDSDNNDGSSQRRLLEHVRAIWSRESAQTAARKRNLAPKSGPKRMARIGGVCAMCVPQSGQRQHKVAQTLALSPPS